MKEQTYVVISHDTINDCIIVKEIEGPNAALVRLLFTDQYPSNCVDIISIMSAQQANQFMET